MANFPFTSYASYVAELAKLQPEFRWLSCFFSHPGGHPAETQVFILDSAGSQLDKRELQYKLKSDIAVALTDRPDQVTTRVVIVRYIQTWSIDRKVVEALGEHFDLKPIFFWQVFDHYYAKNDRLRPPDMADRHQTGTLWTFPVPSEQKSLEACFVDASLNATFVACHTQGDQINAPRNTVIIFLRDPMLCQSAVDIEGCPSPFQLAHALSTSETAEFTQKTLGTRYLAQLERLPPETISSANCNPVEFTYPYLHLLAVEVFYRIQHQSFVLEAEYYEGASAKAQTRILEESWAIFHDIRLYMRNTRSTMTRFLDPKSPSADALLQDYKHLVGQLDLVQSDLKSYVERHLNTLALEDSKQSFEQATAVNRLTVLAFAFVPLSFIATVFGIIGTGTTKLWIFAVAALICEIMVLTILVCALRWKDGSRAWLMETSGGPGLFRCFSSLAKVSLKEAFVLLAFAAVNKPEHTRFFCQAVRRDILGEWKERDENDYPNPPPRSELSLPPDLPHRYMWEKRAQKINSLMVNSNKMKKDDLGTLHIAI
ncbi:uncharacterized protein Z519_00445 [Cladophialophora bantiana CBS 173.52]|uniref:Uncharacterized protein n=1 Tax=Cladophialophora bantiana (strain ATCC 10958 / CBS 173.52 / CDC B-1940 / NIH 8579) TaxID=1442370 RepID=A0A0D2GK51_CLAB1|nr:uncharacterized protein Z519_00445 [Cladophialophora bantiana CBS 173.52]KIW98782.1 hypothetical protein Z519_00445 [Cladophialophora bantiana CBS 173.52]